MGKRDFDPAPVPREVYRNDVTDLPGSTKVSTADDPLLSTIHFNKYGLQRDSRWRITERDLERGKEQSQAPEHGAVLSVIWS